MTASTTLLAALLAAGSIDIRLKNGAFEITGAPAGTAVSVRVLGARSSSADPPLLGSAESRGETLVFQPRFPLTPGLRYRAVLDPGGFEKTIEVPAEHLESSTAVEHVYPSAAVVPENLLKFYFHFSAPMNRGEAYRRIHLLDAAGREVEAPFLELEEELWDPQARRLTLLLDPGRIKRGLVPNQEVGPPLKAGQRYTLVVDRDWSDARGVALREPFRKTFTAGPPDHTMPALRRWRVSAPAAGTTAPLIVTLPEPLDHSLLSRLLDVRDSAGAVIEGITSIEREESEWRFTPAAPWRTGSYSLRARATLEDLAGNRINRPFEVDGAKAQPRRPLPAAEELRFSVTAGR